MKPTRPRPQAWPVLALGSSLVFAFAAASIGSEPDDPPPPRAEAKPPVDGPKAIAPPAPPITFGRLKARLEERMISFEVRFLDVEAGTWQAVGVGKGRIEPIGPEGKDPARWVVDGPALFHVLKAMQASPHANVIQAPRVTAFEAAHAVIFLGPDRPKQAEDRSRIDLSATLTAEGTRVDVDLSDPIVSAGHTRLADVRHQSSCALPEGSSLIVRSGTYLRTIDAHPIAFDRLVVVTARRIIPEAEEERHGLGDAAKPASKATKP